jgi:histidyl-tRNA synthetase
MKYADKIGAKYTMVIGDGEIESGKISIKNMQNGEASEIALTKEEIAKVIKGE